MNFEHDTKTVKAQQPILQWAEQEKNTCDFFILFTDEIYNWGIGKKINISILQILQEKMIHSREL